MSGFQVFDCCLSEVRSWLRELHNVDDHDLDRETYEIRDSCRRALRRVRQPWQQDDTDAGVSSADARSKLLALTPGVFGYINSVPVIRVPCDGVWFRVGIHIDRPDITWQTLRLPDALSRVKSGYFPTLRNPPGLSEYWSGRDEEFRIARNAELEADRAEFATNQPHVEPATFAVSRMFETTGNVESSARLAELDDELSRIRSFHEKKWLEMLWRFDHAAPPPTRGQLDLFGDGA